MASRESVNVGLLGLGVIGSGVASILSQKSDTIARHVGASLRLKTVADLDRTRENSPHIPPGGFTSRAEDIIEDNSIDILIELIGGEKPALHYIQEALKSGKHVITANKEVISKHGPELMGLASSRGLGLLYEASVGGGIPLIAPLKRNLQINDISAIHAIINGTTNYILTKMDSEGLEFSAALSEAQSLGYAEADPTSDVEGFDAAYKIAILATIAFNTEVRPEDVYREGISRTASQDFRYARELGYAIKLLGIAKSDGRDVEARVHPVLIPDSMLLAKVDGVFNAVQVEGDLSGRVIFYGRGAGSEPTANVVVADAIEIAQNIVLGRCGKPEPPSGLDRRIKPIDNIWTRYYIRLRIADQPGVLANITRILGEKEISISSAIQKETDEESQTAEIVIMTHRSSERNMQHAITQIGRLDVVKDVSNLIRVED